MGLDIHIITNDFEELFIKYLEEVDYLNKHNLSRTFCDFINRGSSYGEPELEQIGRITGVDISPINNMLNQLEEDDIKHKLSFTKNQAEKDTVLKQIQEVKNSIEGNIDLVLDTINALIFNLSQIEHINLKLNCGLKDTLNYDYYFTDFNIDNGEGYIGNNFGQDLRNFKKFLEFAKSNGRQTVWFSFG